MGICAIQSYDGLSGVGGQMPGGPPCAPCDWCLRHPSRPCPACNARRRRAVRLVERDGLPVTDAARRMRLPQARVERLLEQEADRRYAGATAPDACRERVPAPALPAPSPDRPESDRGRARPTYGDFGGTGRTLARLAGYGLEDRPMRAHLSRTGPVRDQRRNGRPAGASARLRALRDRRMLRDDARDVVRVQRSLGADARLRRLPNRRRLARGVRGGRPRRALADLRRLSRRTCPGGHAGGPR